jgi:energy-coupling factor transport system ATP-binding protein
MADLTLALCLVGHLLPIASVLFAAAVVPMAAIVVRHRLRALLAGTVAACAVGFLIAGLGLLISLVVCAGLGAVVGWSTRRAWGVRKTVVVGTLVLWPPLAAVAVAGLAVLAELRRLTLVQITNSWRGASRILRHVGLGVVANVGDPIVRSATRDWWATIPLGLLVAAMVCLAVSWIIARPTLRRVQDALGPPRPDDPLDRLDDVEPSDPVPVELSGVAYRYPSGPLVLRDVSLRIDPGELVAVVGPNGSGKSTLASILVGRTPTGGTVTRPGGPGLGRRHGSAIVFQRPEAQVLGVRVRDDVVWGLNSATVDVDGILDQVGLRDLADRETSTLSGGELQRLAVGAALARAPRLLVSDESTSMVDPDGRHALIELLHEIPASGDVAVVHVTHRRAECTSADRVVALDAGRLVAPPGPPPVRSPTRPAAHPRGAPSLLTLRDVGHEYMRETPWAGRALTDVNLDLDAGEGLLVLGRNGSGKSTLAWILAGVLTPTEGTARLAGRPLERCVGQVGLAVQHARLQLLRSTAGADVAAAAGVDRAAAASALASVGLDPAVFAARRVDELSGGEMRRVALAGILAGRPQAIVLDEPFAGLDDPGRDALVELLVELRESAGITLVVVSHDDELPDGLVDRVVRLERGRMVEDSDADRPANRTGRR